MQLLVFWTKFSAQHIPLLAEEGCPRHQKPKDPFRFVADGVVSSARLRRPAELTTITASRYCARASRPSAPLLWLRGIFLMAQPLLRLRPIGLALRALLCEEGNMTHSLKFRPNGYIIDIWLRRSRAMLFVVHSALSLELLSELLKLLLQIFDFFLQFGDSIRLRFRFSEPDFT